MSTITFFIICLIVALAASGLVAMVPLVGHGSDESIFPRN